MSLLPFKISARSLPLANCFGSNEFSCPRISRVSTWNPFAILSNHRLLRSINSASNNIGDLSDNENYSKNREEGSVEKSESRREESLSAKEVLMKLRRYGISGILSYGLLNTAYYLMTFLVVWFYVAPAPGRMGYMEAVKRFLKVMAVVWTGSQVTKLARAGGALALAPFVDRGLSWFTIKFKFESQGKAFMAVVGFCFGLALTLFLVVTLLWA